MKEIVAFKLAVLNSFSTDYDCNTNPCCPQNLKHTCFYNHIFNHNHIYNFLIIWRLILAKNVSIIKYLSSLGSKKIDLILP